VYHECIEKFTTKLLFYVSNHCDTPCICRYNILCTIQIIYLFATACVSYVCSFSTGRRHASPTWFTLYTESTTALIDLPMKLIYCTRKATHFASSRTSVVHKWTDQIYFLSVRWLSNVSSVGFDEGHILFF